MPCNCTQLINGICQHYRKEPPKGFSAKCKFIDQLPEPEQQHGRICKECHRYDQDDTGEWCLFREDDKEYVFRPVYIAQNDCPLENR